jgi:membrane protein
MTKVANGTKIVVRLRRPRGGGVEERRRNRGVAGPVPATGGGADQTMRGSGDRTRYGALVLAALALYAAAAERRRLGEDERPPRRVSPAPWWQPLIELWNELGANNVSIMAAGVAFYALLAIFPGLSALVSLYGLVADPKAVQNLLLSLVGVLPGEAIRLLSQQLHALIAAPPAKLGLGLIVSLALALWSAMSGTSMLMQALTVACDDKEERGLLRFYLTAAALTLALVLVGVVSLLLVAVIPAVIDQLPLPEGGRAALAYSRWPVLAAIAVTVLGAVYRYAPNRCGEHWRWISPGAVAAMVVWVAGSAGFSFYVARFGSYDKTYGALGAVVVLLLWFYLTAYIVLAGAELNTVLARRRGDAAPRLSR